MNTRLRPSGFTLIELAIVLIIIGLILAAILKGQDLLTQARAKRLQTFMQSWAALQLAHLDRKGRYAGDSDRSGTIDDDGTLWHQEIIPANGFVDAPKTFLAVAGQTFYLCMGNDTTSDNRNVIVLTDTSGGNSTLQQDQLGLFQTIDVSIDGGEDAGGGNVRALAADQSCTNATIDGALTEETTSGDWSTAHRGLIWYFDRARGS